VTYDDLQELHYITPIENLASILERGILSHRRVSDLDHESISMPEIQDRRADKRVPSGRPLHEYVNLYFHARNPMMYKRRSQHADLSVLSVQREVIQSRGGVVVTDRNASSSYARFSHGVDGLEIVDQERVFAKYWTHDNPLEHWKHKSIKCAEVLVPDRVDTTFVRGVYVSCPESAQRVFDIVPQCPIKVSPHLFFQ